MQTHLDLIYEQLDTLIGLLHTKARLLENEHYATLSAGMNDELDALAEALDRLIAHWNLNGPFIDSRAADSVAEHVGVPLEGILGLSELLLNNAEDTLAPQQYQILQSIYAAGSDLLDIIREISLR